MKKRLLLTLIAVITCTLGFAQSGKISGATRFLLAGKEGKISTETPQNLQGKQVQIPSAFDPNAVADNTTFDNVLPFTESFFVDGVEMAQCWISMTDHNYSALERLGVKINAKFNDRVTANVPLDAIEAVAALKNVTRVAVSRRLKQKTYRARVLTNVDDVLTNSADAQAAGLMQAYNGSNVVIGIIDTGIDFSHQMFSGRIKKKYVFNTDSEKVEEYTGTSAYYTDETHGTHTSSVAGGSNYSATAYVYTTSTTYSTVNNASFGGMAPGCDLVLCDLGEELSDANMAECMQKIADYAESVGKPYVISLSLGGHFGPHDGTGDFADVCAQYTGPGKIIVFAAGNDGEDGIFHSKQATSASPAQTILSSQTRSSYSMDYGAMITYARTPNVELAAKYYVVNTSTNQILWTSDEVNTEWGFVDENDNIVLYGREISVNDVGADGTTPLSNYFTAYNNNSDSYGYVVCYMEQDEHNDKWNIETILYYLVPRSNNYRIGVSIYPKEAGQTCYIDSWPVAYLDFASSTATVNGTNFTAGTNNCSISDEGTFPSVISVGAYCSSVYWRAGTNYASNQQWSGNGSYLDVCKFSSYQREGYGPLGTKLPTITAPGEVILAAYNTSYTAESTAYYAYGTNRVLGAMSGTSQAAPCAAGITALWLQVKPDLTPAQVKNIMAETAIKDDYVNGTYSYMFGQGKIDALAGIQYLLDNDPHITVNPQSVDFNIKPGETETKTLSVSGRNLEGNITATLTDANGVYSIDKTSISKANAENGGEDITITLSSSTEGNYEATITLSSPNATTITVPINGRVNDGGTASDAYLDIQKYATIDEAGWRTALVNNIYKYTEYDSEGVAWLTLPVYGGLVGSKYLETSNTFGSGNPQKWMETNITSTSNTYAGTTWTNTASATNPFYGSATYFTSATARAINNNSTTNTTLRTVTFYVTNVDEIQLFGHNANSNQMANYPSALYVYECTENADGTLTVASTTTKTATNTTRNSDFKISTTNLDPEKIYMVVARSYRGYLYEIGFRTQLAKEPSLTVTPTALNYDGVINTTYTQTINVKGLNLTGPVTLTLNDANGVFGLGTTSISAAEAKNSPNVNVTFNSATNGTFTGEIVVSAPDVEPVTVTLNAKATAASIDVTISPYGLTTLYTDIPLQIPYDTYDDLLGVYYAKGYELAGENEGEIKLIRINEYIPALTGVIIQGNSGTYTFPKATIDNIPALKYDNMLEGSLVEQNVSDLDGTVMTLGIGPAGYIGFYKYSGSTLAPNKVYIVLPDNLVKTLSTLSLPFGGATTSINNINNDANNGNWYTLQGTKLNAQPTQKGIYIHNGKTVLIK